MKKVLIIWLLILVIAALTFAAGEQEGKGTNKMVALRVWDRDSVMGDVVDQFNKKMQSEGKNIKAQFELIPYGQQVPKFMAAMAAGRAPDIYSLDLVQYPYFISIGAFKDITEEFEALPFKDELPQGILRLGKQNNKVYALPYEIDLSVLNWSKNMFRAAGLDPEKPPLTWDDLIKDSVSLTKDKNGDGNPDQWGFAEVGNNAGSYMFWFMPFIWGNNGRMFDDNGKVVFDSRESKEALQLWYDLIYKYKAAPVSSAQWSSGDRYNAFIAGKLGLFLSGNFYIKTIMKDAPDLDFGVTLIPHGKGKGATFGGGNLIGITSQSKHPAEAWEFIKFAFSKDVLVNNYAPKLMLIPRRDLYENKYYAKYPQMKKYQEILGHAITPYTYKYNQIYDPVLYYLQGSLLGKIKIDSAIKDLAVELKKVTK
ncbi:MAG: ABC transporter substrate-binding protein [Spirochaetes bacterium]|nr:ABC transporter substrate-binding protein [Spirochaetota bacterium]